MALFSAEDVIHIGVCLEFGGTATIPLYSCCDSTERVKKDAFMAKNCETTNYTFSSPKLIKSRL
jgi:hypothetical protein